LLIEEEEVMRGERRGGGRIFVFVFYQKFLGEDTLTASQSKGLVFPRNKISG
jgi:hypothetical protein